MCVVVAFAYRLVDWTQVGGERGSLQGFVSTQADLEGAHVYPVRSPDGVQARTRLPSQRRQCPRPTSKITRFRQSRRRAHPRTRRRRGRGLTGHIAIHAIDSVVQ